MSLASSSTMWTAISRASSVASTSTAHLARRTYAAKKASSSTSDSFFAQAPTDNKMTHFKDILYPADTHLPKSPAPSGPHHPDHLARLQIVLPNPEVHETIERAYKLYQRHRKRARHSELKMKFKAMEYACDVLEKITRPEKGKETYDRAVYVAAVKRPDPYKKPKPVGRRISPEEVWKEARIDGLMPREIWVPTETRGKGWNYDWERPSGQ